MVGHHRTQRTATRDSDTPGRKKRALTQGRLGELMNARQATVSTLEKGARSTRLQTLLDALAALDLELVVRERTKGQLRDIEDIF